MFWLADIFTGAKAQIDYRYYTERAHTARADAVHDAIAPRIRGLPACIRNLLSRRSHWRSRRATIRQLAKLSDHVLRDIGLDRESIRSVALSMSERGQREVEPRRTRRLVDQPSGEESVTVHQVAQQSRGHCTRRRAA